MAKKKSINTSHGVLKPIKMQVVQQPNKAKNTPKKNKNKPKSTNTPQPSGSTLGRGIGSTVQRDAKTITKRVTGNDHISSVDVVGKVAGALLLQLSLVATVTARLSREASTMQKVVWHKARLCIKSRIGTSTNGGYLAGFVADAGDDYTNTPMDERIATLAANKKFAGSNFFASANCGADLTNQSYFTNVSGPGEGDPRLYSPGIFYVLVETPIDSGATNANLSFYLEYDVTFSHETLNPNSLNQDIQPSFRIGALNDSPSTRPLKIKKDSWVIGPSVDATDADNAGTTVALPPIVVAVSAETETWWLADKPAYYGGLGSGGGDYTGCCIGFHVSKGGTTYANTTVIAPDGQLWSKYPNLYQCPYPVILWSFTTQFFGYLYDPHVDGFRALKTPVDVPSGVITCPDGSVRSANFVTPKLVQDLAMQMKALTLPKYLAACTYCHSKAITHTGEMPDEVYYCFRCSSNFKRSGMVSFSPC